jgi:hypothetical protein
LQPFTRQKCLGASVNESSYEIFPPFQTITFLLRPTRHTARFVVWSIFVASILQRAVFIVRRIHGGSCWFSGSRCGRWLRNWKQPTFGNSTNWLSAYLVWFSVFVARNRHPSSNQTAR